jgi:AraC-like DNA-binding protein/mannose-6-phosphate isomerase-like protein (cupin superfamily)
VWVYIENKMKNIPVRHISATEKEPKISEDFSIRAIRDLLAGKDMVQDLHRHDFFLVLALKKGRGNHKIDFASYKISDNSVFFVRPGQVHQLKLKAGSIGYVLQFKNDFYRTHSEATKQILRRASNKNSCYPDARRFKKLLSLLTYIFQEYTDKQKGYQEIIKGNLGIFFAELIRQKSKKTSASVNSYTQERLEEFLQLLETNVFTKKQVSQYAEMLNLSPYQLNAITKVTLGKTCSELIDEYIILEAKRNLLATSSLVNQIAYHLGYEDVSYFIRFFKKQTGYSPEAFRNNFS